MAASESSRRGRLAAGAAVVVAAILPFANVFGLGFVGDDIPLIVQNPRIQTLSGVLSLFGAPNGLPQARALRDASYALDLALGGGAPFAFHLSNVVYHVIAALLVLAVARAILRSNGVAFVAALVFAVHPVHSEAVASLAGRKDVLVTIFALAGLLAFDRFEERGGKLALAGLLGCFGLGFLVKETIVVLPVLALGLAFLRGDVPASRARRRRRWLVPTSLLLGSLALGFVAVFVFRISAFAGGDAWHWHGGSVSRTALTIPRLLSTYVTLLVAPVRLQADYGFDAYPISASALDPSFIVAALVLAIAAFIVVWTSRRDRRVAFASGWILVALLPVLQIVPHHELIAERYLYLPSVGFALLAGVVADRAAVRRVGVAAAPIVALIALGTARAWAHNGVFRDFETLSRSVVDAEPRCARAQYNLGQCALRDGRTAEARTRFRAAVDVGPGSFAGENRVYGPALNELGLLSLDECVRGGHDAASHSFRDAEEAFSRAAQAWPGEAAPWLNLFALERTAGRDLSAAKVLAGAARAGVRDPRVDANLAIAPASLVLGDDRDEALAARVRRLRAGETGPEVVKSLIAFLDATDHLEVEFAAARLFGVPRTPLLQKRLCSSHARIADGEGRKGRRILLANEIERADAMSPPLEAKRGDWPADAAHVRDALERLRLACRAWLAAERIGDAARCRLRDRALEATRAVFEGPARGRIFGENKFQPQNG